MAQVQVSPDSRFGQFALSCSLRTRIAPGVVAPVPEDEPRADSLHSAAGREPVEVLTGPFVQSVDERARPFRVAAKARVRD